MPLPCSSWVPNSICPGLRSRKRTRNSTVKPPRSREAWAPSVRVLPMSNHANVDDVLSIVDGVDNPIVSYSNPPKIRRAS